MPPGRPQTEPPRRAEPAGTLCRLSRCTVHRRRASPVRRGDPHASRRPSLRRSPTQADDLPSSNPTRLVKIRTLSRTRSPSIQRPITSSTSRKTVCPYALEASFCLIDLLMN
uniref:Uncharacterized protein n=1 Tax=Arundo donax TaxID=35708 RepID=A0A0A8YLX1_ARUDO